MEPNLGLLEGLNEILRKQGNGQPMVCALKQGLTDLVYKRPGGKDLCRGGPCGLRCNYFAAAAAQKQSQTMQR